MKQKETQKQELLLSKKFSKKQRFEVIDRICFSVISKDNQRATFSEHKSAQAFLHLHVKSGLFWSPDLESGKRYKKPALKSSTLGPLHQVSHNVESYGVSEAYPSQILLTEIFYCFSSQVLDTLLPAVKIVKQVNLTQSKISKLYENYRKILKQVPYF